MIWFITVLCSLLFLLYIGRKSKKIIALIAKGTGVMFNISLAIGVLFFVNVFSKDSGWLVSINVFTVLTVAVLGIPGIVAIVYINFLRNL